MKSIAGQWPGTGAAALRYVFGAIGLGIILFLREGREGFRFPKPGVQLARGFFVALATLAFFSSIFLMPLATATAVQFTNPILTALISAIFLNETLKRGTLGATIIAFAGVLIVLRPDFATLGWAALLPLVAALAMAMVMITNRKAAGSGSVLLMQFLIAGIAAILLVLAAAIGHFSGVDALHIAWPSWTVIGVCALVAVTASFSHMLMFMATVKASAAAVAPMAYVQLLVALVVGMLFYQDYPDAMSIGGALLIVISGLYLWWRGREPSLG